MDTKASSGGIGLGSLLTIVFVVLKLTGTIGWSWWWVLSPLWITMSVGIVLCVVFVLIALAITGRS